MYNERRRERGGISRDYFPAYGCVLTPYSRLVSISDSLTPMKYVDNSDDPDDTDRTVTKETIHGDGH